MKALLTALALLTATATTPALAAESCDNTIKANVNGLVCDFCARALEKTFGERSEVDSINVDLDNGLVTIYTKAGQTLDDETVSQLIIDAGYNIEEINHGC